MKRITLASLRSDQPQLFEVLLKKNDLFLFFIALLHFLMYYKGYETYHTCFFTI